MINRARYLFPIHYFFHVGGQILGVKLDALFIVPEDVEHISFNIERREPEPTSSCQFLAAVHEFLGTRTKEVDFTAAPSE